jgi:hypothetical protein
MWVNKFLQFTFIPGGALLAGTLAVPSVALREKNINSKKQKKMQKVKNRYKRPSNTLLTDVQYFSYLKLVVT